MWPVQSELRMESSSGRQSSAPTTTPHQPRLIFISYESNKQASLVSLSYTHLLSSPPSELPPSLATSPPISSTSTCPAFPGLLHGYASSRTLWACVADEAHAFPRTPAFLHPLLSQLSEASSRHTCAYTSILEPLQAFNAPTRLRSLGINYCNHTVSNRQSLAHSTSRLSTRLSLHFSHD